MPETATPFMFSLEAIGAEVARLSVELTAAEAAAHDAEKARRVLNDRLTALRELQQLARDYVAAECAAEIPF